MKPDFEVWISQAQIQAAGSRNIVEIVNFIFNVPMQECYSGANIGGARPWLAYEFWFGSRSFKNCIL